MSQIPYATYNPTASPVQSSVVPFVPAPVPQEVQIGTGIENLGPAFSAFSQTLASFVANQVTTNREQALKAGEDKLLKSRKRFKDLVASGEISPQENPWEALGAAAADGTLAAQRFRVKAQAAYNDKIMKDPSFAMSVTGGEDFINEMLANELSDGMQNPVWQRSFMKESSSFAAQIGAVHGDNVAKFRRAKMTEALTIGISSDLSTFRDSTKNMDPASQEFSNLSKKTLGSVQSRIDEAFQTVGADSLKPAYETLVDIELATGSDPAVMALIDKVKAGTGRAVDTEQYRAARLDREDQIEKAKEQRDISKSMEFFVTELRSGKTPEFESFAKHIRSNVRPDMTTAEIADLHSSLIQKTDSMRKQLYENFKSGLVDKYQALVLDSYGMKDGRYDPSKFYSSAAVQMRDTRVLETQISKELQDAANWTMRPISETDAATLAKFIAKRAQVVAEDSFTSMTASLQPAERARLRVQYSAASGTQSSATPQINLELATYSSTQQFTPGVEEGLLMYREAMRQNVDPKSIGLSPQAVEFYKNLDPMVGPGTDVPSAAVAASRSSALAGMSPDANYGKLREAVVDKLDSYLWWDGSTNELRFDAVTEYVLPKLFADPKWRWKSFDQQVVDVATAIERGSVQSSSGWIALPDRSEGLTSPDYWNAVQLDVAKAVGADEALFVLGRTGVYQLMIKDPMNGTYHVPSDDQVEKIKTELKDRWPAIDSTMNPSDMSESFKRYEAWRSGNAEENRKKKFNDALLRMPRLLG